MRVLVVEDEHSQAEILTMLLSIEGFEVAVVKDATAGPRLPEGDGYLAALVNYRFLASAVSSVLN
jgi:DNA-binding response OmpR family regulator